ncbi:MAG: helix-turn-helix transcriptional regulator [Candidatus Limnocylindria bacterium]
MRASRLVTLLLLLQTRGQLTAAELARQLEVSERTVHRDVDALAQAGVPIYAERGPHGGVRLVEGYRTRLTGLTADEAEALFLSGLSGPAAELGLGTVMTAAQLKVLTALPAELRTRASRLVERFYLDAAGWFQPGEEVPSLASVAESVWQSRRLRFDYDRGDQLVEREVEPLGLVLKGGTWYLVARSQGELKTYRISRMLEVELGEERFERPAGFDLASYWRDSISTFERDAPRSEVLIRIRPERRGELSYFLGDDALQGAQRLDEPDPDGWTRLRLRVRWPEEAAGRLLGFGRDLEVLDPPDVRDRIVALARGALDRYAAGG